MVSGKLGTAKPIKPKKLDAKTGGANYQLQNRETQPLVRTNSKKGDAPWQTSWSMGQNPVPPVSMPIPTQIGSEKWVVNSPIPKRYQTGFEPWPFWSPKKGETHLGRPLGPWGFVRVCSAKMSALRAAAQRRGATFAFESGCLTVPPGRARRGAGRGERPRSIGLGGGGGRRGEKVQEQMLKEVK